MSLNFSNPKLVGQIFLGGSIQDGGPVKVIEDSELTVSRQNLALNKSSLYYFLAARVTDLNPFQHSVINFCCDPDPVMDKC